MNTAENYDHNLFSTEKPPMYDVCHKYFGADWDRGTIFAYGDTIHAKYPTTVTKDVEAHEMVHMRQQADFLGGKDAWWQKYLDDTDFRCSQEIEAYKIQIAYALEHYSRDYRRALKFHIYSSMSALSGGTISIEKAKEILG